jgi:hypothetical protein
MAAWHVVAVVGSYRKGGTIDQAVGEILAAAAAAGATTRTFRLVEQRIEFCMNCRSCTQQPGAERGRCVLHDDLEGILQEIERADALVLGAPVNFFDVNALTRRFMERLVGYAHWPWGQPGPRIRDPVLTRKAVLVTSTAMPSFLARFFTRAGKSLKETARLLGARPVAMIWVGLSAQRDRPILPARVAGRCRRAGARLARG